MSKYNTIDNLELWEFKFRTTHAKVEVVFAPELASKSENNPLSYKEANLSKTHKNTLLQGCVRQEHHGNG